MGFYKQKELYLQGLCETHPVVKHNAQVSNDDVSLRRSFYRINDEEELVAAVKNYIHFPCVTHFGLSGGTVNKDGSIRQLNINNWLFLTRVQPDPANPVFATALTEAYDITFGVMMDYVKAVIDEYEENGSCGVFKEIDPGKFKWVQYGPAVDELYGWMLSFSDESKFLSASVFNPGSGGGSATSDPEIIPFNDTSTVQIAYTVLKKNKFGSFPSMQVWISGTPNYQVWPEILVDQLPNPTQFTVKIGGPASGFIKLSAGN